MSHVPRPWPRLFVDPLGTPRNECGTAALGLGRAPRRHRLLALAASFSIGVTVGAIAPARAARAQTPSSEPVGDAPATPARGASPIHLPLLRTGDGAGACGARVHVLNAGADTVRVAIVAWSAPGAGAEDRDAEPIGIACTAPVSPGTSLEVPATVLGGDARSAALFALGGRAANQIDPALPGTPVADLLCDRLASLGGHAAEYRRFRQAYLEADVYAGVPLGAARGGPLAVEVVRRCADDAGEGSAAATAAYAGIAADQWGHHDPSVDGYTYAVPLLQAEEGGKRSTAFLQNAGTDVTTAEVWFAKPAGFRGEEGVCPAPRSCGTVRIAPGASVAVDLAACAEGATTRGAGWVVAGEPLAVVVESRAAGLLTAYESASVDGARAPDGTGDGSADVGAHVAFAPLVYSEYDGWDARVDVQNLALTVTARVRVYFLDRSGDVITSIVGWVCPRRTLTADLRAIADLPGNWAGSVRVESLPLTDPTIAVPPVAAVIELTRRATDGRVVEAMTYPLLSGARAFDWPAGHGAGGLASGTGVVALPDLRRSGASGGGATSQLAVANLVGRPGFTDATTYVFDQNGIVHFSCLKLDETQVSLIDLNAWSFVSPGFVGSAIVSAGYWDHPVYDAQGRLTRNVVGLGAVVTRRTAGLGVPDTDAGGDGSAASIGLPVTSAAGAGLAVHGSMPSCPSQPWPTRTTTPRPSRTPTTPPRPTRTPAPGAADAPSAGAAMLHLPVLRQQDGGPACDAAARIQNAGVEPAQAVLVLFAEPGGCPPGVSAPAAVACTGVIRPGVAWSITRDIPPSARSGVVFSFTARTLAEIGASGVPAKTVGEHMCERLRALLVGRDAAVAYTSFARAFTEGAAFEGVPLDRARGAPLAAEIARSCETAPLVDPPVTADSAYAAVPGDRLGRIDPVSGAFVYSVPLVRAEGGTGWRSMLHAQNAGLECASLEVWYTPQERDAPRSCGSRSVPAGESVAVDLASCAAGDVRGSARVRSTHPMAVVVDTRSAGAQTTYVAPASGQIFAVGDRGGSSVDIGGEVVVAPLVYHAYAGQREGTATHPGWSTRLHIQNESPDVRARLVLTVLDRSGDAVSTYSDWVRPRGALTFDLDALSDVPSNFVGQARVESVEWGSPSDPAARPPSIAGVAEVLRLRAEGEVTEALAYEMLPEAWAFDAPLGHAPGGLEGGVGVIALPRLARSAAAPDTDTQIAIANLVGRPGFTDYVVFLYDQNGLLDYVCRKLNERQTEYIDLRTWGYIASGFRGSAIVSATFWEHEVYADSGLFLRNLVGLAAVSLQSPAFVAPGPFAGDPRDDDGRGDLSAGGAGVPFHSGAARFAGSDVHVICGSGPLPRRTPTRPTGSETVMPTTAPTSTPTASPTPGRVCLPAAYGGGARGDEARRIDAAVSPLSRRPSR